MPWRPLLSATNAFLESHQANIQGSVLRDIANLMYEIHRAYKIYCFSSWSAPKSPH